ncbi:50S ribosomal protein L25/general stress protein Ctc [Xylophilus rhododendri]|uniref:Large ribosomal subunit protein bL25 n=1 Tax=Xylophilus rhododendri TaxID=2697032 RepID=A0A857J6I3_9BURK|nr:50S ribosomal protein L25/general stress protein Ctc [Xylophilus rhododendri]QHI99436.1 50S ribosomal protein L25/general stress protein Ctc [Xylophilus rhododendri]
MKFVAFERSMQGTGASRRLRNSGKTPGIVYGGEGQEPKLVELDHNALWHALKKEVFHSSILDMELAGAEAKVLLRDVQYHPFKQQVLHVDFQRVDAKTRLSMKVPLHFKGQEESPAVKTHANLVTHTMTEMEVACFPGDLPEFIEVDLSALDNAGTVHVNDIKLPKGVKFVSHGKANPVVASAVPPAVEEEIVAPVAAPAADAKKGKGKK